MNRIVPAGILWAIAASMSFAESAFHEITNSDVARGGFEFAVGTKRLPESRIQFQVTVSEKGSAFCRNPKVSLSTVTTEENETAVTNVRDLNFTMSKGSMVCEFSVDSSAVKEQSLCFVFTNYVEVIRDGKVSRMPSADFFYTRLGNFIEFDGSIRAKGLFHNPTLLFADVFLPALTQFEMAKIERTLRGFILRSDTHPGFRESEPSEFGIYLNVAVRDANEVPRFKDEKSSHGEVTERSVEFPATATDEVGLRVYLVSGSKADSKTLSAIDNCINEIRRKSEQDADDQQPARAELRVE